MEQQASIHVESDNESNRSEVVQDSTQPKPGTFFTLLNLIQNLYTLGLTSLDLWESTLDSVKKHKVIRSDPETTSIVFDLLQLLNILEINITCSDTDLSQDKIPLLKAEVKTFNEIMNILKAHLSKKPYKGKKYSKVAVNKVVDCIDSILSSKSEGTHEVSKKNKKRSRSGTKSKKNSKKIKKSRTRSSSCSSSSSSSSHSSESSSSSSTSDNENVGRNSSFDSLFAEYLRDKKGPFVLSQMFQFMKKNKRVKFMSPGEQGTHLIRIEITKTKHLKSCESVASYWKKVSKKGLFLVDSRKKEDKDVLKNLTKTLAIFGKKVQEIENTKVFITSDSKKN